MADYRATSTEFTAVADAIRTKGGTSAQLTWPNEFVSAVQAIPTGSGVVQSLSVTQNGTYNPPSGVDGYAPVVVDVSGGSSSPWNEQFCVNWDFANPINSRGNSEYSNTDGMLTRTIDGWFLFTSGKVELTNSGIIVRKLSSSASNGFFVQCIKEDFANIMTGKIMTFSVVVDGVIYHSNAAAIADSGQGSHGISTPFGDDFGFRIYHYGTNSGITYKTLGLTIDIKGMNTGNHVIQAIKLECGSTQTLAHTESGVTVLNRRCVENEELIKLKMVQE